MSPPAYKLMPWWTAVNAMIIATAGDHSSLGFSSQALTFVSQRAVTLSLRFNIQPALLHKNY